MTDTLDDILDVAGEVLQEYAGEEPGNTRIERLARYIVGQLGGPPYAPIAPIWSDCEESLLEEAVKLLRTSESMRREH